MWGGDNYQTGQSILPVPKGTVITNKASYECDVRPATNLNLDDILFTSAAEGGKIPSNGEEADELFLIPETDTTEWKLTLTDPNRNFSVLEKSLTGKSGGTITLNYEGATVGEKEYISVMIEGDTGTTHYGRVAKPESADGQINPNDWQGSDAQDWCETFVSKNDIFSMVEQTAFLGKVKIDSMEENLYGLKYKESRLTENDKVFFLSAREVSDFIGNYEMAPGLRAEDISKVADIWWLRSPHGEEGYVSNAGRVTMDGELRFGGTIL